MNVIFWNLENNKIRQILTNWPARRGIYSIIASLTLHLLSSASSTIAGNKLCESWVIPITSLTQSRLEIMFSLTSGHSSFNCERNRGSKCSTVLKKKKKCYTINITLMKQSYVMTINNIWNNNQGLGNTFYSPLVNKFSDRVS